MPLPVYRLRRWLMAIAVLFVAVIAGMYFYARARERNVLKEIPNKIGIDVKQTASGFEVSKSDGKRTLFTIQASNVKQFKLNGSAELRNVSIVVYGRDSSRFDRIYGDDFSYDKQSGNVTARGAVQIDLEANPAGETAPDQSAPKELQNPIHLNTSDLVFNQQSGDAHTEARVDFETPQASGWAVGVAYSAKSNTLILNSQIHLTLAENNEKIVAEHGQITRNPRVIVLDRPRLERAGGTVEASQATFFLQPDNTVERVLATGDVTAQSADANGEQLRARADKGEVFLVGKQNLLHTAVLTGNVHIERIGSQPMRGDAGRVVLDFSGQSVLRKIHAADGVRLAQRSVTASDSAGNENNSPQDFEISAPVMDFFVTEGNRLDRAVTSGAAEITISPAQNASQSSAQASLQKTVVTAGRFEAKFDATFSAGRGGKSASRLAWIHGEPNAKIVNSSTGIPDRVSTSDMLDAKFLPEGGIASIVQYGNVEYTDNLMPEKRTRAWAQKASYSPADSMLVLTGSPRVTGGGIETTAAMIRIDRATDAAFADGDVKTTYTDPKEQPNGALLASSSPIHVTAATMTTQGSGATALYRGNARLWQDANVITAPSIEFDRDKRSLLAKGDTSQPVSTVLVQAPAGGKSPDAGSNGENKPKKPHSGAAPELVRITSARLTYVDSERRAHYEGGVQANGAEFIASAKKADAFLEPRSQVEETKQLEGKGRLERMVAEGNVVIQQPGRKAIGEKLVYSAAQEKFVLTGGPPSIFDAERGKITGDSLTFFRSDDRVLVEGEASTPVVTQTRVTR